MKTHQILTGACNPGDRTFAVGSVEGIPFTAYASGCNIVILAKNFNRVQIIPGVCHDNIQIRCIDASIDSGKVAAVYEKTVIIFEPTPLVVSEEERSPHDLDYWWVETARLDAEAVVSSMAWNGDGDRLLTAGDFLQLWRLQKNNVDDVKFEIDPESIFQTNNEENVKHSSTWNCVWSTRPANPIVYLSFSPDGSLIATAGQHDRLVRIWYQNQPLLLPTCGQDALKAAASKNYNFSYIYLAHPQSVTGISWRKTSKYMPRGSVSNMLVTSCMDNICRIWSETILPEDGIVCMQQLDPAASQDSKFRTHRQKTKFIQRFRHMRHSFCARRMTKNSLLVAGIPDPIASLPSTYSVHEFHNYGYQGTGVSPGGLHFHLSATINGVRDIPLVPSMGSASSGTVQNKQNFVLHWLNNKEMHFTQEAEKIMQELFKIAMEREDVIGAAENNDSGSKMSINKLNKTCSSASLSHVPSATSLSHSDVSQTGSAHSGFKLSVSPSEALDHSIETILNEWHQSSDLLYSIHPVDGSLLVWIADFLDEYTPGAFRQAQVSFSARIPCAIPLGDAMTMSSNVSMYNANTLILKNIFTEVLKTNEEEGKKQARGDHGIERHSEKDEEIEGDAKEEDNEEKTDPEAEPTEHHKTKSKSIHRRYKPAPVVSMISKHTNGTLNLWNVMFGAKSKFSTLLNISHASRASGHRFRANGISCHPVLPLVLTTSHHNNVQSCSNICQKENFCSELILWRVDPVGPLSRSGGISELARINSSEISAFTDVAWIPTLLPSNILGNISNSPSAVFVGSDGHHLRIYLSVIDARALLAEINSASRRNRMKKNEDLMSHSSDDDSTNPGAETLDNLSDNFNIVSTQSSSKPGCVIQLKSIDDASHNWANTLLLHAFQGKLAFSPSELHDKSYFFTSKMGAVVDLGQTSTESTAGFSEPFFVLLVEKMSDSSVIMHMWRLVISSGEEKKNSHGYHSSGSVTPDASQPFNEHLGDSCHACSVNVQTEKVCRQKLPLEEGTTVIYAVPAVGHLSSSSIYPACLAPYIMVTICSDNTIRFWRTRSSVDNESDEDNTFVWEEWRMESDDGDSKIVIPGRPLSVCAAYSGRIACAYQSGSSFVRPNSGNDQNTRYVNLCVCIYECESTGGSGWILEDTISLKNIELKSVVPPLNLSIYNKTLQKVQETKEQITKQFDESKTLFKKGMTSVPSLSTYEGVRKYIDKMGNSASPLAPKQSVMLDWVSNENGAHILTIAVGNKVLLLTEVSSDISQANMKAMSETRTVASNRHLLRKSSSMSFQTNNEEIRWMQIRRVFLKTADGLSPTPMATSWVRDGLLLCGMDNEIAVYSQWRNDEGISTPDDGKDFQDSRKIQDVQIMNKVHGSTSRPILSVGSLSNSGKYAQADPEKRKKVLLTGYSGAVSDELDMMPDLGLFEASRLVSPVLPQYHPKQLMELLNSGKIRWVKAILGHLVRCIGGPGTQGLSRTKSNSSSFGMEEKASVSPRCWSKSRTLSVLGTSTTSSNVGPTSPGEGFRSSISGIPEELTLDYTEINSIPPLPLWTLLAADKETNITGTSKMDKKGESNGYDDLFNMKTDPSLEDPDTFDDEFLSAESATEKRTSKGIDRTGLSYFGPRQARIFSKLLTHAHLPGLSSLDQMHLLALADTVASCQLDLADKFAIDAAKKAVDPSLSSSPVVEGEVNLGSLDDCGLRFLLAMKHFNYLKRCLPLNQRNVLQKKGLSSSNLVWGFHSESEEELINSIPCVAKGNPTWPELRELGLAWWLRNNSSLKKLMEKVAKASFKDKNDPLDAAIFYLAMKKKNLVWGLYRSIKDPKMTAFFSNNFSEDRWRKAALKNAFSLLGKQRFLHAAAFFLLSGSIKDAIDICIDKLDDLQLAMIIARLYAGELNQVPDILKDLVNKQVLGSEGGNKEDNVTAQSHPDPFLRSMAHWMNRNYSASLSTLLLTNVGFLHPKYSDEEVERSIKRRKVDADPSVFNFYVYLRTHPLILREQISKNQDSSKAIMLSGFKGDSSEGEGATFKEDGVTPLERRLYFSTAHFHLRAGCPVLALEVLNKLPNKIISSKFYDKEKLNSNTDEPNVENSLVTGIFHQTQMDLSQPKPTSKKDTEKVGRSQPIEKLSDDMGLDWSKPITVSKTEDDDELKLEWSDDPDTDDDYDSNSKNILKEMAHKSIDESLVEKNIDEKGSSFMSTQGGILDIMAQQLKFIACLKIIMEELGTLATGFEVDGGLLRYQLYIWLEREVDALKVLCSYGLQDELNQSINLSAQSDDSEGISNFQDVDPLDFESKIIRVMKRKTWLIENQTLLRTLLSYCGLHGCNGGGLSSVRMELILLLQELQQEKTQKRLLSPLPFPTTLPLLSACIAQQKTVVSDPVKHLEALTHDMLYTMMQEKIPPFPGHANYDELFVLRDLSIALSSCVYQSLCDSDSLHLKKIPSSFTGGGAVLDSLSRLSVVYQDSSLISTTCSRKFSLDTGSQIEVTTEPSKWPGVTALRALLDRDKDEDTPHLNVLLCETFVAIYLSLLCYALATCDSHILFRLISQHISPSYWSHLFGGGYKKSIKVDITSSTQSKEIPTIYSDDNIESSSTSVASKDIVGLVNTVNTVTSQVTSSVNSLTKQRVKLNMKLLGVQIKSGSGSNHQSNDGTEGTPLGSKPATRENFKSPDISIIGKLMSKPSPNEVDSEFYDSGAESELEDEDDFDEHDDPFSNAPPKEENIEHLDPESFSWTLMRFAVIRLSQDILEKFLTVAGIEIPVSLLRHNSSDAVQDSYEDLPVASPLIYGCLRATDNWLDAVNCKLHSFENKSEQLFPGCYADSSVHGPAIEKYKCLFEPQNTPFRNKGQGLGPVKRLWSFLIRQQPVQHVFIKHIFGKRKVIGDSPTLSSRVIDTNSSALKCAGPSSYSSEGDASESFQYQILKMNKPVKVIHKEQDGITAFCINKKKGEENVSSGLMTLATHKELQELDISLLLNPTSWQEGMHEEADFDVLCLSENPESLPASNFLAIQTPGDPLQGSHGVMGSSGGGTSSSVSSQINSPSGPQPPPFGPSGNASNAGHRGTSVMKSIHFPGSQNAQFCKLVLHRSRHLLKPVKKHKIDGVRRLASHTHLPLYVTGCHDGSIGMWEWSHNHPVATVRPSGVFAKVNRVLFTSQGNKFGACDEDGNVSIWQAANSSNPYFTYKCHSKGTSDFVFQGDCSSLFCTSGHSSDGRNVAIWDTLMPQKRCNVASFLFHDNGASSIAYVSSKQQLVTTGKRGEVAVWDLRQRKQIHFFKGHDHSIKCLTLDPNEDFFVTGSLDGDIKIWSLNSYKCFYTFIQEHARHGLFKNISQGVSQVYLDSFNRLYSCGADGSIKVRQLPDRDLIVSSI
ncbi:dmX-like protein 2 isoform X5 [Lepeophtheirus salmonis]|uniref:dmX-like protein 2 isoform X5 n=1 Tax=Lepeophtheirus salmonis TaxID=72036 RepID=UPI001AE9DD3A|nr:dmX-like protein 2 isoform X1 [Lepeophtheirus salmonis]